ncbi:MAG: MoaD/ThiS family protein [Arenicellales bacterium]|jgi:sulfur carrier protein ThiS
MRIEIKLSGELKRYARAGGGSVIESEQAMTVAEAMARLGVEEAPDELLAIVNDEVVPPGSRGQRKLEDNDRLTLMPQLKGG